MRRGRIRAALPAALAFVLFVGCSPETPSPIATSGSTLVPDPTPSSSAPASSISPSGDPVISWVLDPQMAVWARDYDVETTLAGDRFILGHRGYEGPTFAYDPTIGVVYELSLPPNAASIYPYFADGARVSGVLVPKAGKTVAPFTIVSVGSSDRHAARLPNGLTSLQIYERNELHAFGRMEEVGKRSLEDPWWTHAAVVDLTTGAVTDVSPSDAPRTERFEARGYADGKVLVGWFAATSEASVIHRLEVVDLATGTRTDVRMPAEQLATISDGWDERSLLFEDGQIFGYFDEGQTMYASAFRYDIASGTVEPSPCAGWKRVDPGRFLCFDLGNGATLPVRLKGPSIFDLRAGTLTSLQLPQLNELAVQDVADGRVVFFPSSSGPLVVDTRTGLRYRLATPAADGGPWVEIGNRFAIVGDVVVAAGSRDSHSRDWLGAWFDPRVWPLPSH